MGGLLLLAVVVLVVAAMRPATRHTLPARDAVFRVDLNRADTATLCLLPGIGPRLAEAVVLDREAAGPFESAQDLARVRGIGPRTLERLAPYVRIR